MFVAAMLMVSTGPAAADEVRTNQWYLTSLSASTAQDFSEGNGVIVALVDTGVDARHQDLHRNILSGVDIVPGGTGDGRADTEGHGTGMASLIAAHGRGPRDGVRGIAPGARVLPIRIATPGRTGDTNDAARGIEWAVDNGATVICIPNAGGVSLALLRAIERARRSNVVVVAGAGNRPEQTGVAAPASFPGVIAAAAVDRNGNHHPGSVTGPEIVLAAPGVDIVSATAKGGYATRTGTSNASAIIAGAVALVRARYPELPAEQVIRRLTATAIDKGPPGRDEQYGYGVIDLVAALTADIGTTRTPQPTVTGASPGSRGATPLVAVLMILLLTAGATAIVITKRRRQ